MAVLFQVNFFGVISKNPLYTTNPHTLLQEGVSLNYFLNKSE